MLIDIHVHTCRYSDCGRSKPADMISAARDAGLDGLVLTEHDTLWPADELRELRSAFPDMVILGGIEVTVETGDHLLVYGLRELGEITWHVPTKTLLREVERQGAAIVLAHPYRYEDTIPEELVPGSLSAVEVMSKNIHMYNHRRAVDLAHTLGCPVTAASDGHHVDQLGMYALEFEDTVEDERQLAEALRSGRFSPYVVEDRVGARNAWLDSLLPEVDAMIANGKSDKRIHKRYPELTFTIIEHHRQGLDVHWASELSVLQAPAMSRMGRH